MEHFLKKEDFEQKYKKMWEKYTNVKFFAINEEYKEVPHTDLPSSSSTSPRTINSDNNFDVGFVSAGGTSVSAIQFVSELSLFITVPNTFLGKLLNNCSFNASFHLLMENFIDIKHCVETDSKLNNYSWYGNVKFNSSSGVMDDTIGSKQLKNDDFNNSFEFAESVKKQKLQEDNNFGEIMYVKLKGKTIPFSELKTLNFLAIKKLTLETNWKYYLRKCVDASATIVKFISGKAVVLIGSHSGDFAVINLSDGSLISMCTLPDRIESSGLISKCGNYCYIGCYDGKLYCIHINSGRIVWSFSTSDMVKSTPIYGRDSTIIFGSYDKNIYCLSTINGNELWSYKGTAGFLSVPSSIENENIILGASLDGTLTALTLDEGRLLWDYKLESPVFSSPVVYGHNVVVAEVAGIIHQFNLTTGLMMWKFNAGGNIFSSLTLHENNDEKKILFGCHDNYVYCLNICSEPKIKWKKNLLSPVFSTPFISDLNGVLVTAIASTKGAIYLLNVDDGSIICQYYLPNEVFSSPIIEGRQIVFGCRDDYVYCLKIIDEMN